MDDTGEHGPKFLALTSPRMRQFVLNLFDLGQRNYTKAYMLAGYKDDNYKSCQVCASKLAHDTRIQEAIYEEAQRRIKGLVPMAMKVVGDLLESPGTKDEVKSKLALDMMDRAGLHAITEQKTTIEFIGQDPARIHRLRLMAEQLGISFAEMVGERVAALAPPVEAEFEEVP